MEKKSQRVDRRGGWDLTTIKMGAHVIRMTTIRPRLHEAYCANCGHVITSATAVGREEAINDHVEWIATGRVE